MINNHIDFFSNHHAAWLQLLAWTFFPRLSFWFMSSITGGFGFWVGVLFFPRAVCAIWATVYYWDTNPVICICAWVVALIGEGMEKRAWSE